LIVKDIFLLLAFYLVTMKWKPLQMQTFGQTLGSSKRQWNKGDRKRKKMV